MRAITPSQAWRTAALAVAGLLAATHGASAQITTDGIGKIAEVREKNRAGDELQKERIELLDAPAYFAVIGLGDHRNAFDQSADAQAFVDDDGTFWGIVNADNNQLPLSDWGDGEANTTLGYSMHKPKDGPATVTLHLTGGRLHLVDFGGGTSPLEAAVLLTVEITPIGGDPAKDEYFATLSGRGGTVGNETFDWSQEGFGLTDDDYTESGFEDNVTDAELVIPKKEVTYDMSFLCEECDFTFFVLLRVFASNPGGETVAFAKYRDPVTADDADPSVGGTAVTYEGVTLLTPEPSALTAPIVALAALAVSARAARGRARPPSCATPRATAPAGRTRAT
jgi:hypothetical protein